MTEKKNDIWKPITLELIEHLGGIENIKTYQHCATRFRVIVFDDTKVNEEKLKTITKAKGVNKSNGQWQIIFGAGVVDKVYKNFNDYFLSNAKINNENTQVNLTENNSEPWWNNEYSFGSNLWTATRRSIREFSSIFIPLIPVFIAAGLSLAFNSLINAIPGAVDNNVGLGFSKVFDTIGGALLGMLPVMVAWSAMKKFGGPEVYGIAIGLILVAPGLLNSWSVQTPITIGLKNNQSLTDYIVMKGWATIDSVGNITQVLVNGVMQDLSSLTLPAGVTESDITANVIVAFNNGWSIELLQNLQETNDLSTLDEAASSLIGTYTVIWSNFAWGIFAISLVGYQAQVFSALLATALVFYVYKLFDYIMPEMIAIVATPLLTILVSTWLTLWIMGPLGRLISTGIAFIFQTLWTYTNFAWFGLGGFLMAFSYPLLVITGLHQGFTAVEATIIAETAARYGESFTFITAVGSCTNVAVGGAIIGYSIIVKEGSEKSMGLSTGVTANLGITEPAIFGANLDLVYPMVASMLGAGIGGYFVGMTGTYATSLGSASWIGLVQFNPVATSAYHQFLTDNNISACLTNWSPMAKEAIALTLSFISSATLTILFSQTKWGQNSNRARGVEVYSIINKKRN